MTTGQHPDGGGSEPTDEPASVSTALLARARAGIAAAGGWWPFDRLMELALYEPGLGYYASGRRTFGHLPGSGSDFVTAPELSPLFGRALAVQVAEALEASGTDEVFEFGAGSGALAAQLLGALGGRVARYAIVDLSGTLRARQQHTLAAFGDRVRWLDRLPDAIEAVVVGNEVLDAMPVKRLHWDGAQWFERGVADGATGLVWADRPTDLRPPVEGVFVPGTVTEVHPHAQAFVRTLAERLRRGAAFFIDYGFTEREYYHPQRTGGTLVGHHAHRVQLDDDALLSRLGEMDLTAHVDFTGIALAAQEAGLPVLGYTSQARFLFNCGLAQMLEAASVRERADGLKLVAEHEMGELFKVLALGAPGLDLQPLGFAAGDRTHTL
jgi:SAM-dependent MidA family methyltransferase